MARNRKRSRKRSDANSTAAKRLEGIVFYLDESIYSRVLLTALREAGVDVRTPIDACGFGAPDDQWLEFVGERKWIALMRDQRIRYRALELQSLRLAEVGAFVFIGGQATALDTAQIIRRSIAQFANIARSEEKPFIYTFGLSGRCNRVKVRGK